MFRRNKLTKCFEEVPVFKINIVYQIFRVLKIQRGKKNVERQAQKTHQMNSVIGFARLCDSMAYSVFGLSDSRECVKKLRALHSINSQLITQ